MTRMLSTCMPKAELAAQCAALRAALRIGPIRIPALSGPKLRGLAKKMVSASECFHHRLMLAK